jgi:hypothetical protein
MTKLVLSTMVVIHELTAGAYLLAAFITFCVAYWSVGVSAASARELLLSAS